MPWQHCDRDLADDETCACGLTKAQWTVEFNVTRTFRVKRTSALRLSLVDAAGAAVANEPWRATLSDGALHEGVTDELGTAKVPCAEETTATVVLPRRRAGEVTAVDRGVEAAAGPEGEAGFRAAAGGRLRLQLGRVLEVRLQLDPANPTTDDDRYTLFETGARERWSRTLTPADDAVRGDRWLTLRFGGVVDGARYSLEIDPGADGAPYLIVEDQPLAVLVAGPTKAHVDEEVDDGEPDEANPRVAPGAAPPARPEPVHPRKPSRA